MFEAYILLNMSYRCSVVLGSTYTFNIMKTLQLLRNVLDYQQHNRL